MPANSRWDLIQAFKGQQSGWLWPNLPPKVRLSKLVYLATPVPDTLSFQDYR